MVHILTGGESASGKAKLRLWPIFLARKGAARLAGYVADKTGAIAVETAIIAPLLLGGLLVSGNLGFSVYNHQKIYTASYAGASYLQDKVAAGDLSGLKSTEDENGNEQPGEWIATAKLVIKDASGLPLDLDKIDVDTYCACPSVSSGGGGDDVDQTDEFVNQTFYERRQLVETGSDDICPSNCADGDNSRIIAEIIVDYEASSLRGGKDQIREKIVTRLR